MNCTRLLNGIDKNPGRVILRWSTTDKVDCSIQEDVEAQLSANEQFRLEPLSTIRGVVRVV